MPRTGLTASELTEKALDAAEAKMRQNGFGRVGLVDIAREIGVSHVALYKYFPDKAALFDAVSKRWMIRLEDELQTIVSGPGTARERIELWFLALHRAKQMKVGTDPELFKAYDMALESTKPFVVEHIAVMYRQLEALAAELVGPERADEAALILFEAMGGFHQPKLILQHLGAAREPTLRRVLDTVLRGLGYSHPFTPQLNSQN